MKVSQLFAGNITAYTPAVLRIKDGVNPMTVKQFGAIYGPLINKFFFLTGELGVRG